MSNSNNLLDERQLYIVFGLMISKRLLLIFSLKKNINVFKSELNSIIKRLVTIGNTTGARDNYFKINEGIPGDGICALYDLPGIKLRLYCIKYATSIVIVGGGGKKEVEKLQQNNKLKEENYFLRDLSAEITKRIKEGEIWYSDDDMEFEGNLEFNDNEDEDES